MLKNDTGGMLRNIWDGVSRARPTTFTVFAWLNLEYVIGVFDTLSS